MSRDQQSKQNFDGHIALHEQSCTYTQVYANVIEMSLTRCVQDSPLPAWQNDGDNLRGRLIELGGLAGLHTDSDCLLLKDLCTAGIEDEAFLALVDHEIQVTDESRCMH